MIKAEYVDHLGDDLRVVNAARVSFDKESAWETESVGYFDEGAYETHEETVGLKEPDRRLLKYLARHQHFTPFTHCQITLRETVPIPIARQRFKHVVGFTYNEVSRRYVSDTPEFFSPVWRMNAANVKQGSGEAFDTLGQAMLNDAYLAHLEASDALYTAFLAAQVCPEQARLLLPQAMQTSYYVTGSLMAFARAYRQRSDSHSQLEIQQLAKEWDRIIRPLFPEAWAALCDNTKELA